MDLGELTELTEPSDWKFKPLEELDQLLRCPICFEYYKIAMMFPQCSHNFCSLCIRRYLSATNSKCPMCAASVQELELKNNRLLDQLVQQFAKSRRSLLSLVQRAEEGGGGHSSLTEREEKEEDLHPDVLAGEGRELSKDRASSRHRTPSDPPSHHARGKRRLYSVPEAPDLPDSEAFIGDMLLASEERSSREEEAMKEEAMKEGLREGEENVEQSKPSSESVSVEKLSPSMLPWHPEDDSVWEGQNKRPRLFGDLGRCEGVEGDLGRCEGVEGRRRGKEKVKARSFSASESTPSRSSVHRSTREPVSHLSVSTSTSSTLPPHRSSPRTCPTTTSSTTSLSHTHNTSVNSVTAEDSPSTSKVECPICGILVQAHLINRHLDSLCLKRAETQSNDNPTLRKYSKVPRLVYQIMKDKQLKSKLKEYHLSTQGDRQTLISRLKEFILRFNSQCDSLHPKSPKEVAMEIEKEEQLKQTNKQPHTPVTNVKGENTAELERGKREYEETHKDQFSKLIIQASERRRGRGKSRSESEDTGARQGTTQWESSETGDTEDGMMLVRASTDREETPDLGLTSVGAVCVPESPQLTALESRRMYSKRRHITPSPSPPSSPLPPLTGDEEGEGRGGSDPEFVPIPNYHTPTSSHAHNRHHKRPRR